MLAASVWEGLRESCVQPVEGDMRQEGGQGTTLDGTGLCGKESAVVAYSSFEPRPQLAPQVWTRCAFSEEGVMRNMVGMASGLWSVEPGCGIQTRRTGVAVPSRVRDCARARRWGGGKDLPPSTPAVRLPRLSWVTWRTARSLADQECRRSR
jgi:hypothetical protein